uniref:Uncharacterized protein n=1 Tax=Arundo donax TaxID=35708 RepID=A0A0A9DGM7_ARUDO
MTLIGCKNNPDVRRPCHSDIFKKWNKIEQLSVTIFKLPRFNWHTIFMQA